MRQCQLIKSREDSEPLADRLFEQLIDLLVTGIRMSEREVMRRKQRRAILPCHLVRSLVGRRRTINLIMLLELCSHYFE